jgi:GT2 family glycosyltransferase
LDNLIDQPPLRVLAVIVLYKMQPLESAAFRSLQSSRSSLSGAQDGVRVLLYDNTPGGCDPGPLPEGFQYEIAMQNAGLATAYNRALSIAESENYTWLLTLDQDTTLPLDFLVRLSKHALNIEPDNRVAAIVPQLSDEGRPISPAFVRFFGENYLCNGFTGITKRETRALNSASLFRVDALRQIGGFNPYFWLDFLDMYVYRQFHQYGWKIYVAGDIQVEHELSLLHREKIKADRFRNILWAECAFCDSYGGPIRGLALTGRLVCRIWRQRRRGDDPAIRQLTWATLKRRIFQSKARRIDDWKSEMESSGRQ